MIRDPIEEAEERCDCHECGRELVVHWLDGARAECPHCDCGCDLCSAAVAAEEVLR